MQLLDSGKPEKRHKVKVRVLSGIDLGCDGPRDRNASTKRIGRERSKAIQQVVDGGLKPGLAASRLQWSVREVQGGF